MHTSEAFCLPAVMEAWGAVGLAVPVCQVSLAAPLNSVKAGEMLCLCSHQDRMGWLPSACSPTAAFSSPCRDGGSGVRDRESKSGSRERCYQN